jgi:sigma-B regulation protein RsbQ
VLTSSPTAVLRRNNVRVLGNASGRPVLFLHGFGCSQEMWRQVTPRFADEHQVILLDQVGAGQSDLTAWEPGRYESLHGYADDLLEVIEALDLHDLVIVGHSVGSMIAVLAATRDSARLGALVLVGPSPRYVNTDDYVGGFDQAAIDSLLDHLDGDHVGWSSTMAPVIMGNADRPELSAELTQSFCRYDPIIARHFARVMFLADNRGDLSRVALPTLVVQCSDDAISPVAVGEYVHTAIRGSEFVLMSATGHCPNLSDPDQLADTIQHFLRRRTSPAR